MAGFFRNTVILLFILVILLVSVILFFEAHSVRRLGPWESFLTQTMQFYLVFVFLRTATHVFLAFASFFFKPKMVKPTVYPLVSILVPCYNEDKVVREALLSVKELIYPNYEIIVIDDGSSDITLEEVATLQSHTPGENGRVRIIHQENAGKAEALNRGMLEAQGEFIFCMDADGVLSPNVIDEGIPYLLADPKVAAVAGTVEVGNYSVNALTRFQALEYISGLNLFKEAQSFLGTVTVIPGPVGLFRKETVMKVGGYKSDTLAEDCELTLRLLMHGYRTIYVSQMVARTEVPDEFRPLIGQRYRWSRGVFKAIKVNAEWMMQPWKNFRNFLIIFYMAIEAFFIPTFNFVFSFVSINYALTFGTDGMYGYFFGQLIILDVILALFCLALEKDKHLSLILYAIMNRFTYGMSLEILRFFALLDETLGLPLSWGKLVRLS